MPLPTGSIRSIWKKIFTRKRVFIAGGLLLAFLIITPVVTYANLAREISDPNRLMNHNSSGIVLKDREGEVFYEYGAVNSSEFVTLDEISDNVEHALIASEDRNFYDHEGYSIRGIFGAMRDNILNRDISQRGGSTITQQLVKNKLLTNDKNFLRKYQEVSMAVAVERKYTKQEILEMYLNSVYFGEGAFGIHDAAKVYFGKSPQNLTEAESAVLVGLLPAPSAYSPISGTEGAADKQRKRVLNDMVEANYIDKATAETATNQELAFATEQAKNFSTAQHFTLMVLDELKKEYGEERVIRSGYIVTTTLDIDWQKKAEAVIKDKVAEFSAQGGRNASLVSIDPKSGEVRALVGSADWDNETFGKVNMATTPRQPGSSFKPIYYTEALDERKITPATVMEDEKKTYGGTYTPENYDQKFRGEITVRNALAQSLNIPAIDVMQKVGVYEASEKALELGISTVNDPDKYGLSLALGTAEAKLDDMVHAYSALANQGKQHEQTMILEIKDKYGNLIYEHRDKEPKEQYSPEATFLISDILSDERARAPLYGTRLNIPGKQVAMKTGTTNDNKDAWTIGYTPGVVTGVWVGNNENQPMQSLFGGSSAGSIWRETMAMYTGEVKNEKFTPTSKIVRKEVCPIKPTNEYREYFIKGTEPKDGCVKPKPKPEPKVVKPQRDEKKEEKDEEDKEEKPEPKPEENTEGGRGGGDSEPAPEPEPAPEQPPAEEEPAPEEPPEDDTSTQTTSGSSGSGANTSTN